MSSELLRVDHLTTEFSIPQPGFFTQPKGLKAVNDVTFSVNRGETLGIVGCGTNHRAKCGQGKTAGCPRNGSE